MYKMRKAILAFVISFLLLFQLSANELYAASATIDLSPDKGSFGDAYPVDLIINGHGDKFNAAQATVTVSPKMLIKDLTLGDCNFSFLHTPSIQNPSFSGVIVSTYATKCTAYTLILVPIQKGEASLTFSKASVRRYGDAVEVLKSAQDGSYTLTNAQKPSAILGTQTSNPSQDGLYTLNLNVYTTGNKPVSNATVILNSVETKKQQQVKTDNTGIAHFSNLKAGVYDAVVQQGFTKVGETIINVSGPNHVLTIGINLDAQKNNPLMKAQSIINVLSTSPLLLVGMLVVGILVGVCVAIFVIKFVGKKEAKK